MKVWNEDGTRAPGGYLALLIMIVLWCAGSFFLPPLGVIAGAICSLAIFIDMGMNGSRYAEFVPYNLAGAASAFFFSTVGFQWYGP